MIYKDFLDILQCCRSIDQNENNAKMSQRPNQGLLSCQTSTKHKKEKKPGTIHGTEARQAGRRACNGMGEMGTGCSPQLPTGAVSDLCH